MNYFDLLPPEIVEYIYEINHKNLLGEAFDELKEKVDFWELDEWNQKYRYMPIFVRKRLEFEEDKIRTLHYPKYIIWQHIQEERHLHNTVTLLKNAYIQKKKEILFYSFTEGVKLYKSWTKKKMIDTLYNEGRLIEVVRKCRND